MNAEPILLLAVLICAPGVAAYLVIRSYQIGKRDFKCLTCGSCCTYLAKLYPEDIKRLNDAGKTDYMTWLGCIKLKNGDFTSALAHYKKAAALFKGRSEPRGEALTLLALSSLYYLQGHTAQAERQHAAALKFIRSHGLHTHLETFT